MITPHPRHSYQRPPADGTPPDVAPAADRDGAQGVDAVELEIGRVGTPYAFERGRVFNVDASTVISSHVDIFAHEITWLVLAAAGAGQSGETV